MIKNLCSLRFLFILPIVASHIPFWCENKYVLSASDAAVSFFFMLSGFVLAQGYGKRIEDKEFSQRQFLRRQLSKFYPLYVACMVVFFFANYKYIDPAQYQRILLASCMVQSWIPDPNYYFAGNGVSWFLATLFFIYMAFPWIYKFISRLSLRWLTGFCVVFVAVYLVVAMQVPAERANDFIYVNPLFRVADFTLGLCLNKFYIKLPQPVHLKRPVLAGIALLLTYACFLAMCLHIDIRIRTASWYWMVNALTIVYFAATDISDNCLTRLLHWSPMLYLGQKTYVVYLTHALIINIMVRLALRIYPMMVSFTDKLFIFAT